MKAFYAAIDDHISNYENGTITICGGIIRATSQEGRRSGGII
jgi:hypothetical protein